MARFAITIGIVCLLLAGHASADILGTISGWLFGSGNKSAPPTTTTTTASSGGDVQRVTVKDGESYTMRCIDPNATPEPETRRRRAAEREMVYGIVLQEAKYHGSGSGSCRESSIVKNLKTKYCIDARQQVCEVDAHDPVEECGNRPLTLVFTCGMTPKVKGKRGMIVNNMLDD
ncbi:uncharacterized protein LOC129595366 [Paramacrobiotus metropolitanus]|uniref:uncharacterized protein LOC129595366 n=1 Tax=Paramacrobiotus metropolitanus TaxID=2943436 RepID=UPI0024460893|nr:uncharacterized protein LOC129595366 [Paramacrobiotus metropolitanus]